MKNQTTTLKHSLNALSLSVLLAMSTTASLATTIPVANQAEITGTIGFAANVTAADVARLKQVIGIQASVNGNHFGACSIDSAATPLSYSCIVKNGTRTDDTVVTGLLKGFFACAGSSATSATGCTTNTQAVFPNDPNKIIDANHPASPKDFTIVYSPDSDADQIPDALELGDDDNGAISVNDFNTFAGAKNNNIFERDSLFMKQLYRDFYGREIDATGALYWTGRMDLFYLGSGSVHGLSRQKLILNNFESSNWEYWNITAPIIAVYDSVGFAGALNLLTLSALDEARNDLRIAPNSTTLDSLISSVSGFAVGSTPFNATKTTVLNKLTQAQTNPDDVLNRKALSIIMRGGYDGNNTGNDITITTLAQLADNIYNSSQYRARFMPAPVAPANCTVSLSNTAGGALASPIAVAIAPNFALATVACNPAASSYSWTSPNSPTKIYQTSDNSTILVDLQTAKTAAQSGSSTTISFAAQAMNGALSTAASNSLTIQAPPVPAPVCTTLTAPSLVQTVSSGNNPSLSLTAACTGNITGYTWTILDANGGTLANIPTWWGNTAIRASTVANQSISIPAVANDLSYRFSAFATGGGGNSSTVTSSASTTVKAPVLTASCAITGPATGNTSTGLSYTISNCANSSSYSVNFGGGTLSGNLPSNCTTTVTGMVCNDAPSTRSVSISFGSAGAKTVTVTPVPNPSTATISSSSVSTTLSTPDMCAPFQAQGYTVARFNNADIATSTRLSMSIPYQQITVVKIVTEANPDTSLLNKLTATTFHTSFQPFMTLSKTPCDFSTPTANSLQDNAFASGAGNSKTLSFYILPADGSLDNSNSVTSTLFDFDGSNAILRPNTTYYLNITNADNQINIPIGVAPWLKQSPLQTVCTGSICNFKIGGYTK